MILFMRISGLLKSNLSLSFYKADLSESAFFMPDNTEILKS